MRKLDKEERLYDEKSKNGNNRNFTIIKQRVLALENIIVNDNAAYAYYYVLYVIKGRWPEAESVIATDAKYAYYYSSHVLNGRWPEAEAVIATDTKYAYYYALNVIKGRWLQGGIDSI